MATQAYDAVIATITVANDAVSVTKAMVKQTTWREGTSGAWNSGDCTLTAGKVYQFRTPLSGMDSGTTAILPNIKAAVTVAWDTSATAITTVGNYFMYFYAYSCSSLTSLNVPDTSGLTSVGTDFMLSYATVCSSLTSLGVPDTSGLTSVGNNFMSFYADSCTGLTSLAVPDTSGLTTVGTDFMSFYAGGCTGLTSLAVPDTSGLTSVAANFMSYYAQNTNALTALILPPTTGWFSNNNINWNVPAGRLGVLKGHVPNAAAKAAWDLLTVSGKTLYRNYIQSPDNVIIDGGEPEPPTNELIIQPDETASQDTYLSQSAKDTAYGSSNVLLFRKWDSASEALIPLIKFDLTGLPAGAIVSAASLSVTLAATAQRTTSPTWRRILPANSNWVEGATWNYANPTSVRWAGDTGGDGSNAGCRVAGTDYSATPIGSFSMTATSDVAGTVYTSALDLTEFGYMIANNCGFILLYQAAGAERIHSSGATTEAYRPKLTITYTEAGIPKHAMYYARMRGNL